MTMKTVNLLRRKAKYVLMATVTACLVYFAITEMLVRRPSDDPKHHQTPKPAPSRRTKIVSPFETNVIVPEKYNEGVVRSRLINEKIKRLTGLMVNNADEFYGAHKNHSFGINYNVHIFYYCPVMWLDGDYELTEEHLNSVFYPELGTYNCTKGVIERHFKQIRDAGIGVILYSWSIDTMRTEIMDAMFTLAQIYKLKISIVIENYPWRTVDMIRDQMKFIIDGYSHLSSFNRIYDYGRKRDYPVFYIKNAETIPIADWNRLLDAKNEATTVRHSKYDSIVLSQVVTKDHLTFSKRSNFDGFFSYSSSNGASYTSTWKNWHHIAHFAEQYKMLFIPTVGPGYEERIWKNRRGQKLKHKTCRHRSNGNYYGVAFR